MDKQHLFIINKDILKAAQEIEFNELLKHVIWFNSSKKQIQNPFFLYRGHIKPAHWWKGLFCLSSAKWLTVECSYACSLSPSWPSLFLSLVVFCLLKNRAH